MEPFFMFNQALGAWDTGLQFNFMDIISVNWDTSNVVTMTLTFGGAMFLIIIEHL